MVEPTVIHVSRFTIMQNKARKENRPPILVKPRGVFDENPHLAHEIVIHGPSRIVYRRDNPIPFIDPEQGVTVADGSTSWVETYARVECVRIHTSGRQLVRHTVRAKRPDKDEMQRLTMKEVSPYATATFKPSAMDETPAKQDTGGYRPYPYPYEPAVNPWSRF